MNFAIFLRTAFFIEHSNGCFYGCSIKKLYRKILQTLPEHVVIGVLFYEVADLELGNL